MKGVVLFIGIEDVGKMGIFILYSSLGYYL
jgi:hypothetical protein